MAYFYYVIATIPFALYLLGLAFLHARSKPCLVTGRRDFTALCLSLSGVFFIGPGQLLVTWGAAMVWGKYIWVLLAILCYLLVVVIGANLRPRLIVYNVTVEALRKTLTTTALKLDDEACWNGVALNMPKLGVQFYIDASGIGSVATLTRIGSERSYEDWKRFAGALKRAIRRSEPSRGKFCSIFFTLIGAGMLIADSVIFWLHYDALRDAAAFYLSV